MGEKRADGTWSDTCLEKVRVGEPIFVLRAQDRTAPALVDEWCDRVVDAYRIAGEELPASLDAKLAEARQCATDMRIWQRQHVTKLPD